MDSTFVKSVQVIFDYGVIGALAVIAMVVAIRLYREREKLRKDYQAREDRLNEVHRLELKEFQQRYITKAETWMSQYHDQARSTVAVIDALERRFGR